MTKQLIMVTGASSMIGTAILKALEKRGYRIDPVFHDECNLLDIIQVNTRMERVKPDVVIHAAGWNGGIQWNRQYPSTIYHRTARMALNVYSQAASVAYANSQPMKIMGILASCSYPDMPIDEYSEDLLWSGLPNDTVECHGLAKRIMADYGRQLSKQFENINCIACVLTNCYGQGDSYHPDKTKVVGALIRKFVEAVQNGQKEVICWGTGAPLREFMFAPDAGETIVKVMEVYNDNRSPINIGSGQEVSIKELTNIIAKCTGYDGRILWDATKPDGQMKKKLDLTKLSNLIELEVTPLKEGIQKTVDWYIENKELADAKGL